MIIALMALAVAVPTIVHLFECPPMSTQSISTAIQNQGAVTASEARIMRRSPEGRGGILKNNTLVLVNPIVISSIDQIKRQSYLVIPRQPWVAGDVGVTKITIAEQGLTEKLDAILPSPVCIYKVDAEGKFVKVESGTINYLHVEEKAPRPSKTAKSRDARQPPTSYPSSDEK